MSSSLRRRIMMYLLAFLGVYAGTCFALSRRYLSPARFVPNCPLFLAEGMVGDTPVWQSKNFGQGKAIYVLAHGYGGARSSWNPLAEQLVKDGFDVLVPAMPGQDANPLPRVGFGPLEASLLKNCVAFAHSKVPDKPIVLGGLSLGGSSAWLAAPDAPGVTAVFSEGSFCRLDEAIDSWFRAFGAWAPTLLAPVKWLTRWQSGMDPATVVPLDGAKKWKGKAAVFHGTDDRMIPISHGERLSQAANCELWRMSGVSHAQGQNKVLVEYVKRVEALAR